MIYLLVERAITDGSIGYHDGTESVWSSLSAAQVAMENAYAALGDRNDVTYYIEAWEVDSDNLVRIVRD